MKTMTCRQLGGPCDSQHRGGTADELIKAQDRHLREAVSSGDTAHGPAHEQMKGRWRHPVKAMGWYRSTKQAFADLPEDFAEALRVSTETGVGHDRPQVVQVARARDIVGGPIIASIQGGDVQEAADQAQADLEAFLVEDATATTPE